MMKFLITIAFTFTSILLVYKCGDERKVPIKESNDLTNLMNSTTNKENDTTNEREYETVTIGESRLYDGGTPYSELSPERKEEVKAFFSNCTAEKIIIPSDMYK